LGQSLRDSGGAHRTQLALGESVIEIIEFDKPGRPYLPDLSPLDNEFQHFAIVVTDMARALERLSSAQGWTAISNAGPQRLPESSGGVTAFKFRDPDGHPLELLSFAEPRIPAHWQARSGNDLFLGIDHSAVSISDVARSVAFYQALGLQVAGRTFNEGIGQELLDGISAPQVDVIAVAPKYAPPHVELLCYRNKERRRTEVIHSNDLSATRLIFQADLTLSPTMTERREVGLLDPDGHHLQIISTPQWQ
jgi:catechol 2,3-dioxygenase-like lactoylglutathione lyase family enzyme